MPNPAREVTTDVAVIGAGPCGITMANLLALYGVRAVVIDAQPGIYEYPRAVGIDDESLRTYQTIGIVDRLLEDIIQNSAELSARMKTAKFASIWGEEC